MFLCKALSFCRYVLLFHVFLYHFIRPLLCVSEICTDYCVALTRQSHSFSLTHVSVLSTPLQGNDGNIRKFTIYGDKNVKVFPRAHTCFNRIDMPIYKSKVRKTTSHSSVTLLSFLLTLFNNQCTLKLMNFFSTAYLRVFRIG